MKEQFSGSFVFIYQGYGILSSVYQNTYTPEPYPETAKRKKDSPITDDDFQGTYDTIWIEPEEFSTEIILEISRENNNTYNLIWSDSTGVIFKGLGMLRNKELIGTYWKE